MEFLKWGGDDLNMDKVSSRNNRMAFYCPGCKDLHLLNVTPGTRPRWEWNGSTDKPTFRPSVLVTVRWSEQGDGEKDEICHSFVTDGQIQFLGDSTHDLAGQTVELPDVPEIYQ